MSHISKSNQGFGGNLGRDRAVISAMSQNEQDQEADSIIKQEMINQRMIDPMQMP